MAFPRKFKDLLEIENKDVDIPDYVWLTYAVCACEKDSCGWGGWIIESAFKKSQKKYPTGTGDKLLSTMDDQVCPKCRKGIFRTAASVRLKPSRDQTPVHGIPGKDFEVAPIEYKD